MIVGVDLESTIQGKSVKGPWVFGVGGKRVMVNEQSCELKARACTVLQRGGNVPQNWAGKCRTEQKPKKLRVVFRPRNHGQWKNDAASLRTHISKRVQERRAGP